MKMSKSVLARILPTAAAVLLVLAAGAALATPSAPRAAAQAAVSLEYKMPATRALTYQITAEESQVLDLMGQVQETSVSSVSDFTFKAKGKKEKDLLIGVVVDNISMSITGSQGDMSPDLSSVKGKSFDMVLSPLGIEVDVSGAANISYSLQGEVRSLSTGFQSFFPDLPGKPVKIGDTWPASASVEEKMTSMTIRTDVEYVHKLDGIELIDGMECARVVAEVSGSISGAGSQMGQDMTFTGTVKGRDIWFFAIKDGIYVKGTSEATSEIAIDVPAAGATLPMTVKSKTELKLAGKS